MTESDEFLEYECPVQGIDFDVDPLPPYGSKIKCSACDGEHVANETIGTAWRHTAHGLVEIGVEDWKSRTA